MKLKEIIKAEPMGIVGLLIAGFITYNAIVDQVWPVAVITGTAGLAIIYGFIRLYNKQN